ncbi:MAG: lipopolysaccharide kinase InaA family protein [Deltaproteobacteria bacterium]
MKNDEPCSFRAISQGDIRGWVREDICHLLPPPFFEDPVSSSRAVDARVIKESRLRWAGIISLPNGTRIFLKRDKGKGWFEYFKYCVLPSRGRKEWLTASQLEERNVNIPKPLGWMERRGQGLVKESYYISEAVGSGVPCIEDAVELTNRATIIELAKAVRKIHDEGLFHKDFHAGNFLWHGQSFVLTDLHGAKIVRRVSLNRKLWMMSHLFHSLRSRWAKEHETQFLEAYFEGETPSDHKKEEYLQTIHLWMDRLQRRQWRSRTKRCLKESTEFTIEKERGAVYYHRRDFPLDRLRRVVQEHRRVVREEPSALLKNSTHVALSMVKTGKEKICVKQFSYPTLWGRLKECFRREKGLKAWVAANGLRARGMTGLELLAFVKRKRWLGAREGLLMMEVLESGQELDRYLVKGFDDFRRKRRFINAFAQWLSQLHKKGIYHQDMKTCNIWVSEKEGDWGYTLLDLEDVVLDETVDEKKFFRTCLQLNTSIPNRITRMDRLRFLRQYLMVRPVPLETREWVKRMTEETRKRGIVYVAPWGVVEEGVPPREG